MFVGGRDKMVVDYSKMDPDAQNSPGAVLPFHVRQADISDLTRDYQLWVRNHFVPYFDLNFKGKLSHGVFVDYQNATNGLLKAMDQFETKHGSHPRVQDMRRTLKALDKSLEEKTDITYFVPSVKLS